MEIRHLGAGDEDVAGRACRVFAASSEFDTSAFLRRRDAALIVAEDESGIAGWVYGHELIHPDGDRTMVLYALDVAERSRGHGFGKMLVAAFIDHARAIGCTEVWVLTDDANAAAMATYASAGGHRNLVDQVMFSWQLAAGRHS